MKYNFDETGISQAGWVDPMGTAGRPETISLEWEAADMDFTLFVHRVCGKVLQAQSARRIHI